MIYDIHSHVLIDPHNRNGNFLCPPKSMSLFLRLLYSKLSRRYSTDNPEPDLLKHVEESVMDRIVFLAMDACYNKDGVVDSAHTKLIVNNDYVASLQKKSSKVMFGASLHPYRKDALKELERLVKAGACLVKWLPSAQNIETDNKICIPFYYEIVQHKIPLLVHTGVEHSLPTFDSSLNDPLKLRLALDCGVKVIGAHCGTRLFLHEKNYFHSWKKMAYDYPNFFGDFSAFGLPLHVSPLKTILKDPILQTKVMYGSDFPSEILIPWFLPILGLKKIHLLKKIANPFDRGYYLMKWMGVPDLVFSRFGKI